MVDKINISNYDNVTNFLVDLSQTNQQVDITTVYSNFCSDISSQIGGSLLFGFILLLLIHFLTYKLIPYWYKKHANQITKCELASMLGYSLKDNEDLIILACIYSVNLITVTILSIAWIIVLWFYGIY